MNKESENCLSVCHSSPNGGSPNVLVVQNSPNGDSPNVIGSPNGDSPIMNSPLGYSPLGYSPNRGGPISNIGQKEDERTVPVQDFKV